MTSQNVVFLAILAGLGLICLFNFHFILTHLSLAAVVLVAAVVALYELGRRGIVDWEEWIPRPRD